MPESINPTQKQNTDNKNHEKMRENISMYEQRIGITIGDLANEVQQLASTVIKNPTLSFRVKNPKILEKKMRFKNTQDVFFVDDVYGIRIIVDSVDEVYAVLKKIEQAFPGHLDHDYIKELKVSPSVNGKVLRLLQFIARKNETPFEVQITTKDFHEINESLHRGYHNRKYHS